MLKSLSTVQGDAKAAQEIGAVSKEINSLTVRYFFPCI